MRANLENRAKQLSRSAVPERVAPCSCLQCISICNLSNDKLPVILVKLLINEIYKNIIYVNDVLTIVAMYIHINVFIEYK